MLADSIVLVDKSTGSNVNTTVVRVASPDTPNNVARRRSTPFDPASYNFFVTSWAQNPKTKAVTAFWTTQASKTTTGMTEMATITTKIVMPGVPTVLSAADVYALISKHLSFGEMGAAADATDNVVRLIMSGEI